MQKRVYFENLDGIRFFCFLSVFLFHSFHTEIQTIKDSFSYTFITEQIFKNGYLGVNFFFVLSGFLITFLLILEKKNNGQIDLKKFWIRRILRIWPLFYFCLIFGFFIFPEIKLFFGQTPNESANIIYYLTFINNFDFIQNGLPDASILGVLWSIAIEEQFYLVWPIILYIFPIKRFWIPFSSIIVSSLLFRGANDNYLMHEFHTLSCIGDMTIGALGAWLILSFDSFKSKIESLSKPTILLIYTLFFLIYFFRDEISHQYYIFRIFERIIIAIPIIFIILEQNYSKNSFIKLSKFKHISNLGKITYGMYCLHFIGILITITIMDKIDMNDKLWHVLLFQTILALSTTIIISKLSFRFFETPFLKLKNKFSYFTKE